MAWDYGCKTLKTKEDMRRERLMKRLMRTKSIIVARNPFYGILVWHLEFVPGECGTAATDAKKVYFDPEFSERISDEELMFTALHEILHCALGHCFRGRGKDEKLFNLACDIVVNSLVLMSFQKDAYAIDGKEVMHIAPDGREGYLCSVEEVFDMFVGTSADVNGRWSDSHTCWPEIREDKGLFAEWRMNLKKATASVGDDNSVLSRIADIGCLRDEKTQVDWKAVLSNLIYDKLGRNDYSFAPPDRRFADADVIMPSYGNCDMNELNGIWFPVDTSGSVEISEVRSALAEIKELMQQFDCVEAYVSFFDTDVSTPVRIESAEDLDTIVPVGRGGTSFYSIFRYLNEHATEFMPKLIIILTDGCAEFPDESEAMGTEVVWVIREGSGYLIKYYNC